MSDFKRKSKPLKNLQKKLNQQLAIIYKDIELAVTVEELSGKLISLMRLDQTCYLPVAAQNKWSERDVILITYADSLLEADKKPLVTLKHFIDKYLGKSINTVHILPFFPYSSDDGFSVIDYSSV
ncbi:MAG TPA: alpha-amylase, partial [Psychromonas sp.]